MSVNYYDVLGVPPDATLKQIKRAFRELAIRWHPDKNKGREEEATRQFKLIAEAYQVLSDEDRRAHYDATGYDLEDGAAAAAAGAAAAGHRAGGGRGARRPRPRVDPFELFESMFGASFGDPFGDPFGGGFASAFGGMGSARGGGGGGAGGFGASVLDGFMSDFDEHFSAMRDASAMAGGGFSSSFSSFSSSSSASGGRGTRTTRTSRTVIENGRRVTRTETTTVGEDGKEHTTTEEHVEDLRGGGGMLTADDGSRMRDDGRRRLTDSGRRAVAEATGPGDFFSRGFGDASMGAMGGGGEGGSRVEDAFFDEGFGSFFDRSMRGRRAR